MKSGEVNRLIVCMTEHLSYLLVFDLLHILLIAQESLGRYREMEITKPWAKLLHRQVRISTTNAVKRRKHGRMLCFVCSVASSLLFWWIGIIDGEEFEMKLRCFCIALEINLSPVFLARVPRSLFFYYDTIDNGYQHRGTVIVRAFEQQMLYDSNHRYLSKVSKKHWDTHMHFRRGLKHWSFGANSTHPNECCQK